MNERDMWWKIVLVAVVAALGLASVYPIDEKIKWGIDLAGGYSLMYEIDDSGMEGTDRTDLSRRVMEVLQRRVDPKGVFNLVWRPIGHNRIEIQMPRPSKDVIDARAKLETYQEQLRETTIRRSQVMAAISRPAEDRAAAFAQLDNGIEGRSDALAAAATAYDALKRVEMEYESRRTDADAKNLTRTEIEDWVKKPGPERVRAMPTLVRDVAGRETQLHDTASAWDAYQEALEREKTGAQPEGPTTQPTDSASLQRAYQLAVATLLRTNINVDAGVAGATINAVVEAEEALDRAVADVLKTNVDIGRLQLLLDMGADSPDRQKGIDELIAAHPSLKTPLQGVVDATNELQKTHRGGGQLDDPADLQRLLQGAGVLEFRILPRPSAEQDFGEYREALQNRGPRISPGDEYQWFEIEDPADFLHTDRDALARDFDAIRRSSIHVVDRFGDKYYVLANISDEATMTHKQTEGKDWTLQSSRFSRDESGRPAIGFRLDEVGGSKFAKLTRLFRGEQLCIFLDDRAVSSANINSPIRRDGIIMGNFTPTEVNEMVKKLNAGSLPQKLKEPPISVRSIGPSLGAANRTAGLRAAFWAAIVVGIFMLLYYFYAGGVAVVAVAINILLIGAMMATLGATMTLPGIAGLVLAIGMAVDANVLINERIREELAKGTAMRMAIKLGYERAFRAILDSNVTTVLTCVILYMVGSEQVKGFGLTLGVGVFINIFTAYFITRLFFDFMSLITIPREVARLPIVSALVVAATGAVLYGLAYAMNTPEEMAESVSAGFGRALMFMVAPAILLLMILMHGFRTIHHGRKELPMMRLIGVPKVDWIGKRKLFFGLSAVLILGGIFGASRLSSDDIMDIEFLGGTSAQIDLNKSNSFDTSGKTDIPTQISARLDKSAEKLADFAAKAKNAEVSMSDGTIAFKSGIPALRLVPVIQDELGDELSEAEPIRYTDPAAGEITLYVREGVSLDPDAVKRRLSDRLTRASLALKGTQVQTNAAVDAAAATEKSYTVVTRETSKEIVVAAILDQMEGDLVTRPALTFSLARSPRENAPYFPITGTDPRGLGIELSDEAAAMIDLTQWQGGVGIVLNQMDPPQPLDSLRKRLKDMRLQPGFEQYGWRESDVFGLERAPQSATGEDVYSRVMIVVADENYPMLDSEGAIASAWVDELANPEVELIEAALQRQQSLNQVTQFDNEVSGESQIQAILALILSWLLIIVYVWIRFGNVRWGFAAVAALVHDVCIALAAVVATYYLAQFVPALGKVLMIEKVFRIDLAMVAALLTVVGYSVNDTIIVFDRIRENRGRQTDVSADMINESINQTLSRTLLTYLTSLITVFIMYLFGGDGIHSFNYVLFVGLTIGTYSSIVIASQFLLRRAQLKTA